VSELPRPWLESSEFQTSSWQRPGLQVPGVQALALEHWRSPMPSLMPLPKAFIAGPGTSTGRTSLTQGTLLVNTGAGAASAAVLAAVAAAGAVRVASDSSNRQPAAVPPAVRQRSRSSTKHRQQQKHKKQQQEQERKEYNQQQPWQLCHQQYGSRSRSSTSTGSSRSIRSSSKSRSGKQYHQQQPWQLYHQQQGSRIRSSTRDWSATRKHQQQQQEQEQRRDHSAAPGSWYHQPVQQVGAGAATAPAPAETPEAAARAGAAETASKDNHHYQCDGELGKPYTDIGMFSLTLRGKVPLMSSDFRHAVANRKGPREEGSLRQGPWERPSACSSNPSPFPSTCPFISSPLISLPLSQWRLFRCANTLSRAHARSSLHLSRPQNTYN